MDSSGAERCVQISIHALREEGDYPAPSRLIFFCYFYPRPPRGGRRPRNNPRCGGCPISIHALREEGDDVPHAVHPKPVLFLSTPSARRATCLAGKAHHQQAISIHALREEGDFA